MKTKTELERENAELRQELAKANRRLRKLTLNADARDTSEYIAGNAARISNSKSYIGFALGALRASSIYGKVRSAVRIFSRFRFFSAFMRGFTYVIAFLETGTYALLASTVLLVSLPVTAIFSIATVIISTFGCRKANKELSHTPDGKNIFFFFPDSAKQMRKETFLNGWISELASDKTNIVFIVSPCFWKKAGYSSGRYFLHYRKDAENVFVIRKYYYFSMKKHVVDRSDPLRVVMIH